jgi:predicted flap endonuclease-1-like 5' DNA nuclease
MGIYYLLIAGVVGILGYLIGKKNKNASKNEDCNYKSNLEVCKQRNSQLQSDINSLRLQLKTTSCNLETTLVSKIPPNESSGPFVFDATLANTAFGKKVKEDDLKIIEGIGPKIEELFKTSGILTWKRLSETSVDRCNKILDKAGERYSLHDPSTWSKQSKLAYEGKWQELKDWQEKLDGGREKIDKKNL